MRQVQAYRTDDGLIFDSAEQATRHEAVTKLRAWFDSDELIASNSIVDRMIDNAEEIANLLRMYIGAK